MFLIFLYIFFIFFNFFFYFLYCSRFLYYSASLFSFIVYAFGILRNYCLTQCQKDLCLRFILSVFITSAHLVYFYLFLYIMWNRAPASLFCMWISSCLSKSCWIICVSLSITGDFDTCVTVRTTAQCMLITLFNYCEIPLSMAHRMFY